MKRRLLALTVGAVAGLFGAAQAFAWYSYCDWDPPVLIITPAGNVVTVHDSVWTASPLEIGLPLESYTTSRVYSRSGAPETAVDMTIAVPTGLLFQFPFTAYVATGPLLSGQTLASASGHSGSPVHLKFVLPEA